MTFTRDELVAAIEAARRAPEETPNTITTRELAEALSCGEDKARKLVREAIKARTLRPVQVYRVNIAGVLQRQHGYELADQRE